MPVSRDGGKQLVGELVPLRAPEVQRILPITWEEAGQG
jgi:hypothetical protein